MPEMLRYLLERINGLYDGPPLNVSELSRLVGSARTSAVSWLRNGRPPYNTWRKLTSLAFSSRIVLKGYRSGRREFDVEGTDLEVAIMATSGGGSATRCPAQPMGFNDE